MPEATSHDGDHSATRSNGDDPAKQVPPPPPPPPPPVDSSGRDGSKTTGNEDPPMDGRRLNDDPGDEALATAARTVGDPEEMRAGFVYLGKALVNLDLMDAMRVASGMAAGLSRIRQLAVVRMFFADTTSDHETIATGESDVAAITAHGRAEGERADRLGEAIGSKESELKAAETKTPGVEEEVEKAEARVADVCGRFAGFRERASWWIFTRELPPLLYVIVIAAELIGGIATLQPQLDELIVVGPGEGWVTWAAAATVSIAVILSGVGIGKLLAALRLSGRALALLLIALLAPILYLLFPAIEHVRDGEEAESLLTVTTALLLWIATAITAIKEAGGALRDAWRDPTTATGIVMKLLEEARAKLAAHMELIAGLKKEIAELTIAQEAARAACSAAPELAAERKAKSAAAHSRIESALGGAVAAIGQERGSEEVMVSGFEGAYLRNRSITPRPAVDVAVEKAGGPAVEPWSPALMLALFSGALAGLLAVVLASVVPAVAWLALATARALILTLRRRPEHHDASRRSRWREHPSRLVDRHELTDDDRKDGR